MEILRCLVWSFFLGLIIEQLTQKEGTERYSGEAEVPEISPK